MDKNLWAQKTIDLQINREIRLNKLLGKTRLLFCALIILFAQVPFSINKSLASTIYIPATSENTDEGELLIDALPSGCDGSICPFVTFNCGTITFPFDSTSPIPEPGVAQNLIAGARAFKLLPTTRSIGDSGVVYQQSAIAEFDAFATDVRRGVRIQLQVGTNKYEIENNEGIRQFTEYCIPSKTQNPKDVVTAPTIDWIITKIVAEHPEADKNSSSIQKDLEEGVNFGTKFTLVRWSCGTYCLSGLLVDRFSGSFINVPTSTSGYECRKNSKLLIVDPDPSAYKNYYLDDSHDPNEPPAWYFRRVYGMLGKNFKLIYKDKGGDKSNSSEVIFSHVVFDGKSLRLK